MTLLASEKGHFGNANIFTANIFVRNFFVNDGKLLKSISVPFISN
jgi:hypothetical protein